MGAFRENPGLVRRHLLGAAAAMALPRVALPDPLPEGRRVAMSYEVEVPAGLPSPVSLWLPVPQADGHQSISDLHFSPAVERAIQTHGGNRYWFARVASGARVRMEFRLTRTERRVDWHTAGARALPSPACCLGADRLVPVDGRIRQWAEEVVREARARTPLEKARAIYEHVVATVKYDKSGKGWGRGDIYYACDARRGNCSDFHAIFIGYARAVGLPAQFVIGLPLPSERGTGEIAGYHCWAEFFAPETGWVPVDASEAAKDPSRRNYFFGALDENRVEFTRGRDVVLAPPQAGEPLNYFVYPYAEAAGQAVEGLRTRFVYRDEA